MEQHHLYHQNWTMVKVVNSGKKKPKSNQNTTYTRKNIRKRAIRKAIISHKRKLNKMQLMSKHLTRSIRWKNMTRPWRARRMITKI